jgi:hypothetical protein
MQSWMPSAMDPQLLQAAFGRPQSVPEVPQNFAEKSQAVTAIEMSAPDSAEDLGRVKRWTDRHFLVGSRQRQKFEALCAAGCDPKVLLSFLTLAALGFGGKRTVYDVFGVSRSALVKLPARLEKVSRELESVDPFLGHYIQANFVENPNRPGQVRARWEQQAAVYRTPPKLLRLLAGHIRDASGWVNHNFGPRRFDTLRTSVVDLLKYVDVSTGSPHYEQVSELLEHVFLDNTFQKVASTLATSMGGGARRKKKVAPSKLLSSPDALKALYRRSAVYGFRKTKPARKPR